MRGSQSSDGFEHLYDPSGGVRSITGIKNSGIQQGFSHGAIFLKVNSLNNVGHCVWTDYSQLPSRTTVPLSQSVTLFVMTALEKGAKSWVLGSKS